MRFKAVVGNPGKLRKILTLLERFDDFCYLQLSKSKVVFNQYQDGFYKKGLLTGDQFQADSGPRKGAQPTPTRIKVFISTLPQKIFNLENYDIESRKEDSEVGFVFEVSHFLRALKSSTGQCSKTDISLGKAHNPNNPNAAALIVRLHLRGSEGNFNQNQNQSAEGGGNNNNNNSEIIVQHKIPIILNPKDNIVGDRFREPVYPEKNLLVQLPKTQKEFKSVLDIMKVVKAETIKVSSRKGVGKKAFLELSVQSTAGDHTITANWNDLILFEDENENEDNIQEIQNDQQNQNQNQNNNQQNPENGQTNQNNQNVPRYPIWSLDVPGKCLAKILPLLGLNPAPKEQMLYFFDHFLFVHLIMEDDDSIAVMIPAKDMQ